MTRRRTTKLRSLYEELLASHGLQGWWPIQALRGRGGFDERGYHPGRYDYPKTDAQRFEVILGAILTQNTAWANVERALLNLHREGRLDRDRLSRCPEAELTELIRPSGYFREKAKKIRSMLEFLDSGRTMTRENLLGVWGVGPETADSILLYALHQPVFVCDTYTKRILEHRGFVGESASYDEIQALFHNELPADPQLFNEYHALIVAHARRHHRRKPQP